MEIINNKVNLVLWFEKYWIICLIYIFKYNENVSVVFEVFMKLNEKVLLYYGVDNVLILRFLYYFGLFFFYDFYK